MKKLIGISIASAFFITLLINNQVYSQSDKNDEELSKSFPIGVTRIFEESCVKCHLGPGIDKARFHFNLTNWDEFSTGKQARRANAVLRKVTNEKMPPKKFTIKHPESVPTKEEIKIIKEWAGSLKKN